MRRRTCVVTRASSHVRFDVDALRVLGGDETSRGGVGAAHAQSAGAPTQLTAVQQGVGRPEDYPPEDDVDDTVEKEVAREVDRLEEVREQRCGGQRFVVKSVRKLLDEGDRLGRYTEQEEHDDQRDQRARHAPAVASDDVSGV